MGILATPARTAIFDLQVLWNKPGRQATVDACEVDGTPPIGYTTRQDPPLPRSIIRRWRGEGWRPGLLRGHTTHRNDGSGGSREAAPGGYLKR